MRSCSATGRSGWAAHQLTRPLAQQRHRDLLRVEFEFEFGNLENGGSERLIDTIVPQGSPADLAPHVQAHLDADADHVCLQTVGVDNVPEAAWAAMASALGR